MKIDIVSESLVVDVGYLCYPLVNREIRSHQEFPNHMIVGVVAKNAGICWNRMILFISFFTIKTANLKISGFMEKPRVFFIFHVFVGF